MRRKLSLVVALILAAAVVATIIMAIRPSNDKKLEVVTGVIGSEKQPFFDDPSVKAAFKAAGYDVRVDTAGSRQMATMDLSKYDFAFPAGTPAAEKIKQVVKAPKTYVPFFTPMAIGSYKPVVDLLAQSGVAIDNGGWWSFDMEAYLNLTATNTRWADLPGDTGYKKPQKSVLITSTDIAKSNSAAQYASIASYVANGNNVVDSPAAVPNVIDQVAPLFSRQGYTESSSEGPFLDYLTIGMSKTPLVMIYESQFLYQAAKNDGSIKSDMILMYPDPAIFSKHTLVPLNAKGDAIGNLLTTNAELQRQAVLNGYRTNNSADFAKFVLDSNLSVPENLPSVIDPPNYDTLEALISTIQQRLTSTTAPSTTDPLTQSSTTQESVP
jgi:hypothetical protein